MVLVSNNVMSYIVAHQSSIDIHVIGKIWSIGLNIGINFQLIWHTLIVDIVSVDFEINLKESILCWIWD